MFNLRKSFNFLKLQQNYVIATALITAKANKFLDLIFILSMICIVSPCGGIGRRGRLKIYYLQGCGSSSLPEGTTYIQTPGNLYGHYLK